MLVESKKHKRERWAKDKTAGKDGEDWAKVKLKARHPLNKIGSHKKNDDPYDVTRKPPGNKKTKKIEVKLNNTPLSKPQKIFQKKSNTEVMRVSRNNPVHVARNVSRKIRKIIKD